MSSLALTTPQGTLWEIRDATWALSRRAELPGARLFDMTADALRRARDAGLSPMDRLTFARTASWLVNSPAHVRVLRRWALPPNDALWLSLFGALEGGPSRWSTGETRDEVKALLSALGANATTAPAEPYLVEATSKVLALVFPELVPLMPPLACTFLHGDGAGSATPETFVATLDWFAEAVTSHHAALQAIASAHKEVPLEAAQALDRMLWFDSDGHRHFPPPPGA